MSCKMNSCAVFTQNNPVSQKLFRVLGETLESDPRSREDLTADETTWNYHATTGLLLTKTYSDEGQIAYTYDAQNRLASTTWTREVSEGVRLKATRPLAIQKDGTWFTYGYDLTKNVYEVFGPAGYIRTLRVEGAVLIASDAFPRLSFSGNAFIFSRNLFIKNDERKEIFLQPDERHHQPVQTPRLYLPVVRYLRRLQRIFRLRTSRRRVEKQYQAGVVERYGAPPRRHCRA